MKNTEPISACCSAPIKSVGMGDFHDKDEVGTMHFECTKCYKPCNPVAELSPDVLRNLLHDFAMTYRVESRKSRNECIDNVIMKIGNLMEENQSLRNKNRVLQDCVVAVMVEKKVLRKALEKMVKASDELNDDCDSGDRHDPECSMCKSTKEAKESLSQVSQYSASTQTLKQAFDDVEDSLSKSE